MNANGFDIVNLVNDMVKEYSAFIGKRRGTVGIDGLKTVHKRVLYAFSTIKTESKQDCKTSRLVGETLGKYHPHADSGTIDAITTLVIQKFIKREGNWGNFFALEKLDPAAIRYTSVVWNREIFDPIFENIDNVPFIEGEIGFDEPEFLPVMIPLCLINTTDYNPSSLMFGISTGISTIYPLFKISDLIKYIKEGIKTDWNCKFKPKIFLGSNVKVTVIDGKDTDPFTKKDCSIKIEPVIDADPKERTVIIRALPKKLPKDFVKELKSKCSVFSDKSKVDYTELYMKFTRTNYYEEYLPKIKNKITDTKKLNNVINYKDQLYDITVEKWLQSIYIIYKRLTVRSLNDKMSKIDEQIEELNWIKKIQPYVKKSNNVKELLTLTNKAGIDESIVNMIISKYSIKKLLTFKTDTDQLIEKRKEYENNLSNINDYMISLYDKLNNDSKKIFKIGAK